MIDNVPQAIKRLLSIGGDSLLHAVDDSGRTALHLSARDNNKLLSEFFVSRGANSEVIDKWGFSPSHYKVNLMNELQDNLTATAGSTV